MSARGVSVRRLVCLSVCAPQERSLRRLALQRPACASRPRARRYVQAGVRGYLARHLKAAPASPAAEESPQATVCTQQRALN